MNHLSLIIFILYSCSLLAEEKNTTEKLVDENKKISGKVDRVAKSIDNFFSGLKNDKNLENKSQFVIKNTINSLEGEGVDYKPDIDIKLHLPNLERKWKIEFTSYRIDNEEEGVSRNRLRTETNEEQFGAGLVLFESLGDIKTKFRPRLEFDGQLQTAFSLSFDHSISMYKEILFFRPALELFARHDTGTGQFFALNFQYIISEKFSLAWINEEQYTSLDHALTATHGLRFYHVYTDKYWQEYALNYEFNKDTNYRLTRYTLSTSFFHEILQRVLHYKLTPYLVYDRENRFSAKAGFRIEIDIIF